MCIRDSYNSGQFWHTLEYLVPFEKDAFTFYEKLGSFYEKKGYSEISHSRMRRYEILLEYLQEETDVPTEVAAQKMLYDLYLREKLKKRPAFASDQKQYETCLLYTSANRAISIFWMHLTAGSWFVILRKQQDFRQQLLSNMFLLQELQ